MAQNDMEIIVYKILSYLYECSLILLHFQPLVKVKRSAFAQASSNSDVSVTIFTTTFSLLSILSCPPTKKPPDPLGRGG